MSWDTLKLGEEFKHYFKEHHLAHPTKIQQDVIPALMEKKSVVVLSETGSGKTLSYAIPLMRLLKDSEIAHGSNEHKSAPLALIMAPTRELAQQIHAVLKGISHHLKLRVRVLSGGSSFNKTRNMSHSSYDILVATPSRVKSGIRGKELSLAHLKHVIFDESDNLFEMGFRKDLESILDHVDLTTTQLGFFSATLPLEFETFLTERFANRTLEKISSDNSHKTQTKIETYNVTVTPAEKNMVVKMFLEKEASGSGIIFANQKNQAEDVFKYLKEKMPKLKIRMLHGDLESAEREEVIGEFREKKFQVLVSTDVASRGIDIPGLMWVLNYGLPKSAIYYLHRCGRVARGGKRGLVYNLVASHDAKMVEIINQAIMEQKHLKLDYLPIEKKKVVRTPKEAPKYPPKNSRPARR